MSKDLKIDGRGKWIRPITFCIVSDCGRRRHGNGYCEKHYRNVARKGYPIADRKPNKFVNEEDYVRVFTKNGNFIIDKADVDLAKRYHWSVDQYAYTKAGGRKVYLHRILLKPKVGLLTDHINRDKLDNRRANLREATWSLNNTNKERRSGGVQAI